MSAPTYYYVELDYADVPRETRRAAYYALIYGVRALGLNPPPRVRWMREASDPCERMDAAVGELTRWVDPDHLDRVKGLLNEQEVYGAAYLLEGTAVWVLAGLPPRRAARTVLHELRHRWQYAHHLAPGTKQQSIEREADADGWARAHLAEALRGLDA